MLEVMTHEELFFFWKTSPVTICVCITYVFKNVSDHNRKTRFILTLDKLKNKIAALFSNTGSK